MEEYRATGIKADYEAAVATCDEWGSQLINRWLDQVEAGGDVVSYRRLLDQ